jgi:hypothetical protein
MKRIILVVGLTLFGISIVQAQTQSDGTATRKKTIQKGNVLRKKAPTQPNNYHANNGSRSITIHKKPLTTDASRSQPIVTKPLPPQPAQQQP